MADWRGNRREARFEFREVSWADWSEGAVWGDALGGTIELSAFSDTKESGTISFTGKAPNADNLLRAYYLFADDAGEQVAQAVATMLVEVSSPSYFGDTRTGFSSNGKATLHGVLKVLWDRVLGAPLTLAAGTDAIAEAASLIEGAGLLTNNPEAGSYFLASGHTFAADETLLGVVNWLLSAAGYESAFTDEYGVVQLVPYVEPTERSVVMTFSEGEDSVMQPLVGHQNDWQQTPNAVRLSYESETEYLTAWALNIDSGHRASLVSRGGREKTQYSQVSELAGGTTAERLGNMVEQARRSLVSSSAEIEYVSVSCPYLPITTGDAIGVDYALMSTWKGAVTNFTIDVPRGCNCTLKARRFVRRALKIDAGGEVVWSA